ncbi:MAG: XRE family transcriptional regulator [Rhodospirillales bacterium]|nr:XRE family transcriptional regulator [Rhodospirillales bacterium]
MRALDRVQLVAEPVARLLCDFAAGGLTQSATARHLGVTQPRLNDLVRGRIDKFSLDALVVMLARAGRRVAVKVGKAA